MLINAVPNGLDFQFQFIQLHANQVPDTYPVCHIYEKLRQDIIAHIGSYLPFGPGYPDNIPPCRQLCLLGMDKLLFEVGEYLDGLKYHLVHILPHHTIIPRHLTHHLEVIVAKSFQ